MNRGKKKKNRKRGDEDEIDLEMAKYVAKLFDEEIPFEEFEDTTD